MAAIQTASGKGPDRLDRDVPTCTGARNGTCLSAARILVVAERFAGVTIGAGAKLYSSRAANRTRPLCPYPKVARYNGSGSIDVAGNFSCQ